MKETGIIMSGDHSPKCLDGTKTMTRRVIVPQPRYKPDLDFNYYYYGKKCVCGETRSLHKLLDLKLREEILKFCPYGGVGDRLWVRETWRPAWAVNLGGMSGPGIQYKADRVIFGRVEAGKEYPECQFFVKNWRPSIHMPRWASRGELEITALRAERLQEITEEDARAEGIDHRFCFRRIEIERKNGVVISGYLNGAKARYSILWDSLNAKRGYGWETNPWVWVIGFKKLEGRV